MTDGPDKKIGVGCLIVGLIASTLFEFALALAFSKSDGDPAPGAELLRTLAMMYLPLGALLSYALILAGFWMARGEERGRNFALVLACLSMAWGALYAAHSLFSGAEYSRMLQAGQGGAAVLVWFASGTGALLLMGFAAFLLGRLRRRGT